MNFHETEYVSYGQCSQRIRRLLIDILIAIGLSFSQISLLINLFVLDYGPYNAFKGGIVEGYVRIVNIIGDMLGRSRYIIFTGYEVPDGDYGLFITFIFILLCLISFFIIKSGILPLFIFYYIAPVVFTYLLGVADPKDLFMLILFTLLAAFSVRYGENYRFFMPVGISLIFILMGLIVIKNPAYDFLSKKPVFANVIYDKNTELIHTLRYRKRYITEDETALSITMENPESTWLRGYVGESYNNGTWVANPNNAQYNYLATREILKNRKFNGLGQLAMANALVNEPKSGNVSIEMKKANREYMLIPYEISDNSISRGENYGDSFIKSKGLFGKRKYSYFANENLTSHWTDIAGEVFTNISENNFPKDYMENEAALNIHNYNSFTHIDRETMFHLENEIGSTGDYRDEHIDYKWAINNILDYMENKLMYKPDYEYKSIRDTLENHGGNDRAYAALATAMFRYYKIPARYVEGYLITREDANNMESGIPYDIMGKNFHAWTEIYIDSIGWVPIETVPEFKGMVPQADLNRGIDNENLIQEFKKHSSSLSSDREGEIILDNHENSVMDNFLSIFVTVILIFILFGIIFRLILILIKSIKMYASFMQKDVKSAVSSIYYELKKRYENLNPEAVYIGNRACYSPHNIQESDREYMLSRWRSRRKLYEKKKNI